MAESSHWYNQDGAIVDCKPAEAKKKGYFPGSTMVENIVYSFGLTRYTQQQHMEAVISLIKDPIPDPIVEDMASGIIVDEETKKKFYSMCRQKADEHRKHAAKFGSLFHTQMARYLLGKNVVTGANEELDRCYNIAKQWADENILDVYLVEVPAVNKKYKYGGTVDLYAKTTWGDAILDWKTRNISHPGVKKNGELKAFYTTYPSDITQLSAYKMLLNKNAHLVSIIVNKNKGFPGVFPTVWKKEEEIEGWRRFLAARRMFEVERGI